MGAADGREFAFLQNPQQLGLQIERKLAHLIEVGHTPAFWAWVDRYPQAEKAKGYLEGYSTAARLEPPPGMEDDPEDPSGAQLT